MKKVKVTIPAYMAIFYYPIALMFMAMIGGGLVFWAYDIENLWIKVPMLVIGWLFQAVGFISSIYMLYILGKSIIEDEKKESKKNDKLEQSKN